MNETEVIYYGGALILGLVVWFFCAYLAYKQAPKFGRRNITWGILGLIFGPFALFALYLLPKGNLEQPGGKKADPRDDLYQVPRSKR